MSIPVMCEVCGETLDSKIIRRHIAAEHMISIEEYYTKHIDPEAGLCSLCGNRTRFLKLSKGFSKYCSTLCEGRHRIININEKYPGHQVRAGKKGYIRQKELHPDVVSKNLESIRTSHKRLPELYIASGKKHGPKNMRTFNSFRKQHGGCGPYEWKLWSNERFQKLLPKRQDYRFKKTHKIIMDFSIEKPNLCIEIDGASHTAEYDKARDVVLASLGWRVLHFSNKEVAEDTDDIVSKIYAALGGK